VGLASPGRWVKLEEGILESIVQLHDGSLITTAIAVVGSGEYCDDISVMRPIVPLHNQLMSPGNQGQSIRVVECLRYVLSEGVSGTTRRDAPAATIVGIRPEEVAHRALMWNLLESVQSPDVVQGVDARRESSVKTEDLSVHQGGEGEVVKQIGEILPHVGVTVLAQTLVIEAINLCDLSGFVVSPEEGILSLNRTLSVTRSVTVSTL